MTNEEIYVQLRENYRSISVVAKEVGCSRNTIRNFLKRGLRSDYGAAILTAAQAELMAIEVLRQAERMKREEMAKSLIDRGKALLATAV